jgi:hypothetical protein
MARAEVQKAAHHHVQVTRVQAPLARAASSTSTAGATSSSSPSAGSSPEPIIVVLGPVMPFVVTEVPVEILPSKSAPTPVPIGSISST